MWLLSSMGRPRECAEAARSFARHASPEFRCVLWVDGKLGKYDRVVMASGWRTRNTDPPIGLARQMNWLFAEYPDEPFYGWLADDFRARSDNWDKVLSDAAGDCKIAYADDMWKRLDLNPLHITSAFALGGDLVRKAGWFSPPMLKQAGIDSFWNNIGRRNNIMVHCKDAKVEHLHWKNKKRPMDKTDNTVEQRRNGNPAWREFQRSTENKLAERRLREFIDAKTNLHPSNPA